MTQIAIKKQIADIHKATTSATKSPSAALKFLKEAGIIQKLPKVKTANSIKIAAKRQVMPYSKPFQVECFYSCDKELALDVLRGKKELDPSKNGWDWLGHGIYFWEQNPKRAWEYAFENSKGKQFNKKKIKTPFVLGAIVELGECLNLVDQEAIQILQSVNIYKYAFKIRI